MLNIKNTRLRAKLKHILYGEELKTPQLQTLDERRHKTPFPSVNKLHNLKTRVNATGNTSALETGRMS